MALRVRVCRTDEVPHGGRRGFRVEGVDQPVMVTDLDGELIATASMCPHEDVSLVDGTQDGEWITCPGHAYQFDLRTGRCAHDPRLLLVRYRVTLIDDEVWVDLV
jgi:nitrite reductase/ring-hydroxylating ferredoxin subunit